MNCTTVLHLFSRSRPNFNRFEWLDTDHIDILSRRGLICAKMPYRHVSFMNELLCSWSRIDDHCRSTDHWRRILDLVSLCTHSRGHRTSFFAFFQVAIAFDYVIYIDWNGVWRSCIDVFLLSTQKIVVVLICVLMVIPCLDMYCLSLSAKVDIGHCEGRYRIFIILFIIKFDQFSCLWALTSQTYLRWLIFLSLTAISWHMKRIYFSNRLLLIE